MRKFHFPVLIIILFILPYISFSQNSYHEEIKQTATAFINSLDPLQKRTALLSFKDTARLKWNNLPVGMRARAGISIGNMTEDQRKLLHRLLSASLSSQGYLKATSIMHLDNLINWYYDSLLYKKEINKAQYTGAMFLKWTHRNYYLAFSDSRKIQPGDIKSRGIIFPLISLLSKTNFP